MIAAAIVHAVWNLLAKALSGADRFIVVTLFALASVVIYAPIAGFVVVYHHGWFDLEAVVFLVGSALIHTVYYLTLQRAYLRAEYSVAYPIARGTGPLVAMALGVTLLGDPLNLVGALGAFIVVGGVISIGISSSPVSSRRLRSALFVGLSVGICIGLYTLWDSYAVTRLGIPPVVVDWGSALVRSAIMIGLVSWRGSRRDRFWVVYRGHWRKIIGVGALSPLAYILVLSAYRYAPVTLVAPLRESSVAAGVFLGALILKEEASMKKLVGVALVIIGVAVIASS